MTASDPAAPPSYEASASTDPISLNLVSDASGTNFLVSVTPPKQPLLRSDQSKSEKSSSDKDDFQRAPVDFVLTIDVSGSMGAEAPVPGDNERTGLSVLDVVRHAAKTIITTMRPEDRVAIVTFSNSAKIVCPLLHTDETGKAKALSIVEELRPLDSTNLWDGLKTSMNILTGAPTVGGALASLASATTNIASRFAHVAVPTSTSPSSRDRRLSSIFLLTDGMPNVNPPRGIIPMLQIYLEEHRKTQFTINTFGFGYSLDSVLLYNIARIGKGTYGFIPDSGMVGTVFVHAIANSYATYAEDLVVDVEAESSAIVKSLSLPGSLETSVSGSSICVALGPLQYGQTKDIIVNIPNGLTKSPLTVSARCRPWNLEGEIKVTRVINDSHLPAADTPPDPSVLYHNHRLEFSQKGLEAGGSEFKAPNRMYGSSRVPFPNEATATFKQLVALTRASFPGGSSTNDGGTPSISTYAHDLASDIENEVLLGVQDAAAFNRWGQHYILSLSRSHQRQQCSNFKDMGLQCYGQDSPLFVASRNEIDRVFDDLPPPEPKQPPVMQIQPSMMMQAPPSSSFGGAFGAPSAQAPPVSTSIGARPMMFASMVHPQQQMQQQTFKKISSMSRYNQQQAPCFSGSCLVDLSDGAKVSVEAIRSGSTVKTPTGTATVMAVIKTVIQGGVLDMCHLGEGLVITPWHPIFQDGEWRFPAEIATPRRTPCNAVYSLVLEANRDPDAHAATIGGMLCVTMGHGVTTTGGANDARSHPFLGSHSSVIRALAAVEAYKNDGGVYVSLGARKDPVTGLMDGFVWDTVTKLDEGVELRSEVGKPILALV